MSAADEDVRQEAVEPEPDEPDEKAPRNTAALREREAQWHRWAKGEATGWYFGAGKCSACGKVKQVAGRLRSTVRCLDCERRNRARKTSLE